MARKILSRKSLNGESPDTLPGYKAGYEDGTRDGGEDGFEAGFRARGVDDTAMLAAYLAWINNQTDDSDSGTLASMVQDCE
jgi:hypothetical protein